MFIGAHEGCEYIAYTDSEGHRTIGIGFNLEKEGADTRIRALGLNHAEVLSGSCTITDAHASALFTIDLDDAIQNARGIVKNFGTHPDDVQMVIVDMIFNLGAAGFQKFIKLIAALEVKDYCTAANEMQTSKWAQQVPNRAKDNIAIIRLYCQPS